MAIEGLEKTYRYTTNVSVVAIYLGSVEYQPPNLEQGDSLPYSGHGFLKALYQAIATLALAIKTMVPSSFSIHAKTASRDGSSPMGPIAIP